MPFEIVHDVLLFHDRPRAGIADFGGLPHYYKCEWDEAADDYANTYVLTPLDGETFALALEECTLRHEWQTAVHGAKVSVAFEQLMIESARKYEQLTQLLRSRIAASRAPRQRATANFKPAARPSSGTASFEFEVEWTAVP